MDLDDEIAKDFEIYNDMLDFTDMKSSDDIAENSNSSDVLLHTCDSEDEDDDNVIFNSCSFDDSMTTCANSMYEMQPTILRKILDVWFEKKIYELAAEPLKQDLIACISATWPYEEVIQISIRRPDEKHVVFSASSVNGFGGFYPEIVLDFNAHLSKYKMMCETVNMDLPNDTVQVRFVREIKNDASNDNEVQTDENPTDTDPEQIETADNECNNNKSITDHANQFYPYKIVDIKFSSNEYELLGDNVRDNLIDALSGELPTFVVRIFVIHENADVTIQAFSKVDPSKPFDAEECYKNYRTFEEKLHYERPSDEAIFDPVYFDYDEADDIEDYLDDDDDDEEFFNEAAPGG